MKQNLFNTIFSTRSLALVLSAIIAGYLVWNTGKTVQKNYRLQQEIGQLKEEVKILELENENLKLNNEYYKTDDYLKLEAKRKFDLVENGEKVIIVSGLDENTAQENESSSNETKQQPEKSNFQQWIDFILGRKK